MSRRWLALAGSLLACAGPGDAPIVHPDIGTAPPPRPAPSVSVTPTAPLPLVGPQGPLSAFFTALAELRQGTRPRHVRLLWLGDSHTNADFLSGSVRSALAAAFGDGGPGFVRIGTPAYRHDGVKLGRDGHWNVDPDPPARRAPQDDGIFGLSGTRATPEAGASFSVQPSAAGGAEIPAHFELAYALLPHASFELELGPLRLRVDAETPAELSASGIAHLSLEAPEASQLLLTGLGGSARFFGVVIERNQPPGVVVDTLGIDGARLATPLAWNEAAFAEEVARRSPELFVIAYGTNEAFDGLKVERYGPQLAALVGRVRRGAPQASCLVLGPTDAPLGDGSVPRVAEVSGALAQAASPLGCSFVGLQQLMGGEGSFARGMRAKERLAQPDRLHLTPKGYQELGRALAERLLAAQSAGRGDVP